MMTRLEVRDFKNLRDVALDLGPFSLFVGANASGKSNFFDALRVLQGIGNGFTVSEILDGKPKSATAEAWEGIRGGSVKACYEGAERPDRFSITAHGVPADSPRWKYGITLAPAAGRVAQEALEIGGKTIYRSVREGAAAPQRMHRIHYYGGADGGPLSLNFESSYPVLTRLRGDDRVTRGHAGETAKLAAELADMQRMDPAPSILRNYSRAQRIERMGERGENFAALVETLTEDPAAKSAYLEWLRELRPEEVDDVATLRGAVGEPLFMLREAGKEFPAPVLSDGTLRFAGLVAACFQPDMPRIMTIEEIENGVHPSRARILVELLRSQAARSGTQVVATTHSPTVLAWLDPSEYATTYCFRRDPETGEASVTPLSEVRDFEGAVAKHPIGDLLAEGWLEAVR